MYRDPAGGGLLLHVRGQNANISPDYETTGWYTIRYPSLERTTLWLPEQAPISVTTGGAQQVFGGPYGVSCISLLDWNYSEQYGYKARILFGRYEGSLHITEEVYGIGVDDEGGFTGLDCAYVSDSGDISYVVVDGYNLPEVPHVQQADNRSRLLATRMDPRLE